MAVLREARILVDAPATQHTWNAHQAATVKAMCELILPKTDTPGATDVGASDFIDLMLTEWYDDAVRSMFLSGLADVDARTQTLFGKDFVESSPIQQAEILTALGEKMLEELEPSRERPQTTRRASITGLDKNFYVMLRRLTLTSYYTSEAGATAELHYEIVPDQYDGCATVNTGKQAAESR
jgi:hypothetical protein